MKNRNFIRHVSLLTAMLIMVGSLAGCGNSSTGQNSSQGSGGQSGSPQASKITVLLPQNEMDTVGFMKKKTQDFEKETGIQVELINMSWDNVADKVTTEMTAGGNSYDVIEFDNSWVSKFTANKWIVPLDSYMTSDMKSGIIPGLLKIFTAGNSVYGIPWNNDTRFFMYNQKKLTDAGIQQPPKTWDELTEDSKILQKKGLVKYGYIDSYAQAQALTNELTYMVYSFGGDYLDNSGKPTATSTAVSDAYRFLQKAINVDKIVDPASMTSDQENAATVFCQGDTAFFLQAWAGMYSQANTAGSSKVVGQIAVAPYSVGKDGNTHVALSLPEAMAIPSTSKNKDAAWKYIAYMSSKTFDKDKALAIGALPIYSTTFGDAEVLKKYPYWENFGKQSQYAKGLGQILWYDQFSSAVQAESQKILLNEETTSAGLSSLQDKLTKISQ